MMDRIGAAENQRPSKPTHALISNVDRERARRNAQGEIPMWRFLGISSRRISSAVDVCLASGVLYHMQNSAELIGLMAARCSGHIIMWDATLRRAVRENEKARAHVSVVTRCRTSGIQTPACQARVRQRARVDEFLRRHEIVQSLDAPRGRLDCLKHFGFGTSASAMRSSTTESVPRSLWSLRGRSSWQIDHRHVNPDSRIRASTGSSGTERGFARRSSSFTKACPHATAPSEARTSVHVAGEHPHHAAKFGSMVSGGMRGAPRLSCGTSAFSENP